MDWAHSLLEIKSLNEDQRIIEGFASTPTPDFGDDVMESDGAKYTLPMPLLWHHQKDKPIGKVIHADPRPDGIFIKAQITKFDEPGALKDRLDEAWHSIKSRLVQGLSIGWKGIEGQRRKTGGFHVKRWHWVETSAVTLPMNAEATILSVKSLDAEHLAASGDQASLHKPRDRGALRVVKLRESTAMKTYAEQLKHFETTREQKLAEMDAIMLGAGEKGETLDAEQSTKHDELEAEVKALDDHITRLRGAVLRMKETAKPANGENTERASAVRAGLPVIQVRDNAPAGIGFARVALAKANAYFDQKSVNEVIAERWPDDTRLKQYFTKAAVPAGMTTVAAWAGNLVDQTNLASEFLEYLRPQTIIGRIPNLRRVPFNIRVTGQTTGAVAGWVGEAKAKPVTSFSTNAQTLLYTKIAAISVITQELARFSSPSAEALVRDELARAVVERMDIDFIDPAQAAVATVNPASITNGVTPLSSAGTSADNIRTDIQNLLEQFVLNNMQATNVVLIMPNTLALAASMLVNANGGREFPDLTINGGSLLGLTVITSQYAANQSGSGNLVIALDPQAIFLADDGQVTLDASREASIEMSDAPTGASGATPAAVSLVSMYQTNSIAIKAERFINWAKARTTAVSFIDDVNWGSIGSPS